MLSVTDWGPVVFATITPCIVLILAGLIHAVYRLGKLDQEVKGLRDDMRLLKKEGRL